MPDGVYYAYQTLGNALLEAGDGACADYGETMLDYGINVSLDSWYDDDLDEEVIGHSDSAGDLDISLEDDGTPMSPEYIATTILHESVHLFNGWWDDREEDVAAATADCLAEVGWAYHHHH
jgi:hypothetical protein